MLGLISHKEKKLEKKTAVVGILYIHMFEYDSKTVVMAVEGIPKPSLLIPMAARLLFNALSISMAGVLESEHSSVIASILHLCVSVGIEFVNSVIVKSNGNFFKLIMYFHI